MLGPADEKHISRGVGERGQPLGERSLKSIAKAIVTTRYGVAVEAGHCDPLEPHARQRQGAGPQNNPDTLFKKLTFLFNTNPPHKPAVHSHQQKGAPVPLLIPRNRVIAPQVILGRDRCSQATLEPGSAHKSVQGRWPGPHGLGHLFFLQ